MRNSGRSTCTPISLGSSPGTSATTSSSASFSKISTLGVTSRAGRVFSWFWFCIVPSPISQSPKLLASRAGRHRHSLGLRLSGFGQRQREHPLPERCLDLVGIDVRGQLVTLGKRETLTFAAVHG